MTARIVLAGAAVITFAGAAGLAIVVFAIRHWRVEARRWDAIHSHRRATEAATRAACHRLGQAAADLADARAATPAHQPLRPRQAGQPRGRHARQDGKA